MGSAMDNTMSGIGAEAMARCMASSRAAVVDRFFFLQSPWQTYDAQ